MDNIQMEHRPVTIDCGMRLFNLVAFDIDPLGEDANFINDVRYEASQHSAKPLDPGGRQRDEVTLSKTRYLGVLSEKIIADHLRSIFGHEVSVSNRAFEQYDAHVDIEIQVGDKEISFEVRSSFPYSPLKSVVCKLFDFIGPYTTSFKVGESPKAFYLRGLINEHMRNFNPERKHTLYFAGGVPYELLKEKGRRTDFDQPGADFLALKLYKGMDALEIIDVIKEVIDGV